MKFNGSSWHRWDLHVHTPNSIQQEYGGNQPEKWEKFIADLESLPEEFKVIGINDYLFLDGYQKILDYKQQGRLTNIHRLLPVIELRIRALGGVSFDKPSRINLHVIFSDEVLAEDIESQFLSHISWKRNLEPGKPSDFLGVNRKNVQGFGKAIRGTSPKSNASETDIEIGFHNLNVEERDIFELLENSKFENKHFIAIGVTEWANFRWDASAAEKKHLPNQSNFLFTASPNVESYQRGRENLKKSEVNDLLLHCSDAHCFSDNSNPEEIRKIGHCFTWIKGEPVFESLRQIQFEPESRLHVSERIPNKPHRTVERIHLNFPEQTEIGRKGKPERNPFCLAGNHTFEFSPYFTCLVGGRGTGKSTILSLLANKLGHKTAFFEQNQLSNESKKLDPDQFVEVEGSHEIDFIAQSQVEDLAESPQLTDMIYDRLRQFADVSVNKDFSNLEAQMKAMDLDFEEQATRLKSRSEKRHELETKNADLKQSKRSVESHNDPSFNQLNKDIGTSESLIQRVVSAKNLYEEFREKLTAIKAYTFAEAESKAENPYETYLQNAAQVIQNLLQNPADEVQASTQLKQLESQQKALREKLDDYLQTKGLSQENIHDFENAMVAIPRLEEESKKLTKELTILNQQIQDFETKLSGFRQAKGLFESSVRDAIAPLNERLKKTNAHVSEIRFEYEFDEESAREQLFDDFLKEFGTYRDVRTVGNTLRSLLFDEYEPSDNPTFIRQDLIDHFESTHRRDTNASEILRRIFELELNFDLYRLAILLYIKKGSSVMMLIKRVLCFCYPF
jgi:DNA repair protein SbcC/Rad50